jgi:ABC-type nitrate/sulfonate/bicarbonate transport system substrate-binding protein
MKKILLFILTFFVTFGIFSQTKDNTINIYVPKTLSSIPVIELDNTKVDNKIIKITYFDDHIMTLAEFISGKFPILMTGFSQGLANFQSSKNIVMVTTPVWGVSSLITNNPDLKKLSDFEGKTILVPFAKSPLELQLKAMLKKENLENKVKIDYAIIQQQIPLLLTKKADGICIPEPLASKLVIENKGYKVFTFADEWASLNNGDGRSPQVSLFVKNDFAKTNNKFLTALIKSLRQKIESVKKNPANYPEKYAAVFNFDKAVIEAGLKNVLFDIPDSKTTSKICADYQSAIEDKFIIPENFYYNYK